MSTITTINGSDAISTSDTVINTNFSNLNTDKIETSTLDTDTALTANSDSKIATQKAVKAYVDAGGNVNASETTKGIVEEATDAEVTAGTATGATGAKLFVSPAKLLTRTDTIVSSLTSTLQPTLVATCGSTSRDITNTGTQTIAHGIGRAPKKVTFYSSYANSAPAMSCTGVYTATAQSYVWTSGVDSAVAYGAGDGSVIIAYFSIPAGQNRYAYATASVDATNITLTWQENYAFCTGTVYIVWQAEG